MNRSSFYSEYEENIPDYKIIILGLAMAGKTALLTRYQHNFYDDRGTATLSIDYNIKKRQNAWYWYYDTCGQEAYRAIVSSHYKGSDACIIVYDVSEPRTFSEVDYYYNQIKDFVPDALVYIVGCKVDKQKKVQDDEITKKYQGAKHFLTSSKANQGIHQLFNQIQHDLLKYKKKIVDARKSDIFSGKLSKKPIKPDQKRSCCSK